MKFLSAAASAILLAIILSGGPTAAVHADSLDNPAGMDPSCIGHEKNRETYLKELEWVVNGGAWNSSTN